MIGDLAVARQTRDALHRGIERARAGHKPVLVSVTERIETPDPLDVFVATAGRDRFYWNAPDEPAVASVGAARAFHYKTAAQTDRAWQELLTGAIVEGPAPRLFGALPFDNGDLTGLWQHAPIGRLVLPRLSVSAGSQSALTVNLVVGPSDSAEALAVRLSSDLSTILVGGPIGRTEPQGILLPDDGTHFRALVSDAVSAIRDGRMQKVVAARAQYVEGTWEVGAVLDRLRTSLPHCITFAVAGRNTCFLGATPEWLVRLRHGEARMSCLAGTAPRGRNEAEDDRRGEDLLADSKNLHEHAFVLEEVLQSLDGAAMDVQAPDRPVLMKLPNLQHLYTPISAIVPQGSVLALAERLHPTPAVAGFPRQEALRFLREQEHLDRGGYGGPVGWMDGNGDGEFAVAIRSAVLSGGHAAAFAGCGIVEDSDPESEYQESLLKLRPMLAALGAHLG